MDLEFDSKMDAPPTAGLNGMNQLVCDGGEGNVGGEGEDRHCAEPLAKAPLRRLTHTALILMEKIKYPSIFDSWIRIRNRVNSWIRICPQRSKKFRSVSGSKKSRRRSQ
jgi:hypothetical protein